MSLEPLSEIYESDYGDDLWFGGGGCGLISVGEWSAGGCKKSNPEDWAELHRQAKIIRVSQDLLEALEKLFSIGDVFDSAIERKEPPCESFATLADAAHKAIARAKGESQ